MKNVKLFRILSVVIFLSLLLLASPAAPAKAARGITLSPTEGTVGARITITGTEFNKSTADTDKYAAIYFSSEEATTLDDIDSDVTYYKLVNKASGLMETVILKPPSGCPRCLTMAAGMKT